MPWRLALLGFLGSVDHRVGSGRSDRRDRRWPELRRRGVAAARQDAPNQPSQSRTTVVLDSRCRESAHARVTNRDLFLPAPTAVLAEEFGVPSQCNGLYEVCNRFWDHEGLIDGFGVERAKTLYSENLPEDVVWCLAGESESIAMALDPLGDQPSPTALQGASRSRNPAGGLYTGRVARRTAFQQDVESDVQSVL